jgi:formylglycine-generating enzyme required for sulfatase activity
MKRVVLFLGFLLLLSACSVPPVEGLPGVYDPGIDPDAWALVPAGSFLQGQFSEEVDLDYDFEMMVTPVTNQQFVDFLNQALPAGEITLNDQEIVGFYPGDEFRGYRHEVEIGAGDWLHFPIGEEGSRVLFDGDTFEVVPGYENHPVVQVTWFGARGFCQFFGWALPTELEWEKAARGTDGRAYPWGDEIETNNANFYASRDPFEENFGKIGDTTPVGFYNGGSYDGYQTIDSSSPYGIYDLAGNVEEWTGDVYKNQHYRYLRGGSKAFYGYDLRTWVSNNASPYYHSPSIGFRCARLP